MKCFLEVCVDSVESALAAQAGGADRLELCADLMVGGTSPTPALIREVLAAVNIPVNVLLRPRFGDFCYTDAEKRVQLGEIEDCRALGINGLVLGTLTEEGELDKDFLKECVRAAGDKHLTLHRAFDVAKDPFKALEDAVELGFDTILTSGQQSSADKGAELLGRLVQKAGDRITILAGAGVGPDNLELLAAQGVRNFHTSGKKLVESPMKYRREGVPMGLPLADEFQRSYTDENTIRRIRAMLNEIDAKNNL